jgi:hypothetical protein
VHSKAVIQAWLGSALRDLAPNADVWGGDRRTEDTLCEGDRCIERRIGLFGCVGSRPMVRYARSSRIEKRQVAAYMNEEAFAPSRKRVFFVLGHPDEMARVHFIGDARRFLRCISLSDAADHVASTGRGTINSDLLEALETTPSNHSSHNVVLPIEDTLSVVASDNFVELRATKVVSGANDGVPRQEGFGWLGRPTPLCVAIDAAVTRHASDR